MPRLFSYRGFCPYAMSVHSLSVRRVRTFFVRTSCPYIVVRTSVRTLLFAEISFLWYLSLPAVRSVLYTHTILQAFYGGRLKV